MRSDESFQPLVAMSIDRIARSLLDPRRRAPEPESAFRVAPPAASVQRLGHGHRLLDDDLAPADAFHFFASHGEQPWAAFKRTVATAVEPATTVNDLYRTIFDKEAEADELATLVPLIADGRVSPTDLVRALLASDKLGRQGARFIAVPDTSAWLLGLARGAETIEIASGPDA